MERMKPQKKGLTCFFRKRRPPSISSEQGERIKTPIHRQLSYETAYLHCVGKRERQEDAYIYVNEADVSLMSSQGLLAVVADGMGGMYGGQEASAAAIQTMRTDFEKFDRTEDFAKQLLDSVHHANSAVYDLLRGRGGSTLIACILFQEKLYYAGVGDSFLYLLRNGQLVRLNREQNTEHRLYRKAIEQGRLDPAIADGNAERAAVTQYLGMDALDDVDYFRRPLKLMKDDVLLLCSDGVAGMMDEETIVNCLNRGNAAASCAALDQAIVRADNLYQDNYTALVIWCDK